MSENDNNVVPSTKRSYVSRKDEFLEHDVPMMQTIIKNLTDELNNVESQLKNSPNDESLLLQKKELTNKRVRAYTRLRKLGYNSRQLRSKVAAAKKETSNAQTLPPVPESVPPAE